MYILTFKTRTNSREVQNPKKVRIRDLIATNMVKIKDGNGKWQFVGNFSKGRYTFLEELAIKRQIKDAIKNKEPSIYFDFGLF